jgi:SAM-dependent methyltransferase
LLRRIASRHASILEVGCGQGVDSIELCTILPQGARYAGIDCSACSLAVALANAKLMDLRLAVRPEYYIGNAEALDFDAATFDAVYSMGVLHHTPDERAAIREIHRVLTPGGKAYICLYRKPAPKVAVAKLLRAIQRSLDLLVGGDRCIYALFKRVGSSNRSVGTMFHECFGVPYMKWYNRMEISALFDDFVIVDAISIGANFGRLAGSAVRPSPLGYFWLVEATK